MVNNALEKLSYGLFVLTANEGGKDNGCIINTAIQSSSSPKTVTFCVSNANYTKEMIEKSGLFSLSVISQSADFELFRRFGFSSGKEVDKFDGFSDCRRDENGLLYITRGTNAYLSAKVIHTQSIGSHTLFVGEILSSAVLNDSPSATYAYYHEHIKPKPSENAASSDGKKVVWRCKVCGYEYEGEALPADYICPLCKHPAEDFEKVMKQSEQGRRP